MSEVVPGFTLYPHQERALDQIVTAYDNGAELVVVDAPPGTGKTVLAEAVRRTLFPGGTCVYLCTTLSLQDQIQKDFWWAGVLKGRSNYPTRDKPEDFPILSAADCTKRRVTDEDGETSTVCHSCTPWFSCPYERAKAAALVAGLAVLNTSYFITEANGPGRFSQPGEWGVLDECDRLDEELMRAIEVNLAPGTRRQLGLGEPRRKTVPSAWVEWLDGSAMKVEWMQKKYTNDDSVHGIKQRERLERLGRKLRVAADGVREGSWIYDGYQSNRVVFRPVDVKELGEGYVWRHRKKWLAMSGTAEPAELWAKWEVGFPGTVEVVRVPSVTPPRNRPVVFAGVDAVTNKTKDVSWPKLARAVEKVLARHEGERGIVHTVSGALATYLYEHVSDPQGRLVLYAGGDSRKRTGAIGAFEGEEGKVLVAPGIDRGYDGKDDLLRFVVICKVPYPSLGSKQVQARLYRAGGQEQYAAKTARTLVQMSMRGVRHERDECVTYILDEMFHKLWQDGAKREGGNRWLASWWAESLEWNSRARKEITS